MRHHHLSWFVLAVLLFTPVSAAGQESLWKLYFEAGDRAFQDKRFDIAEARFGFAEVEAGKFGAHDPRRTITLCHRALARLKLGKIDNAVESANGAMQVWGKTTWMTIRGPEPLQAANDLTSLASALLDFKKYDLIERLLKQAYEIQTALLKEGDVAMGRTLYYLAVTNFQQGNKEGASENYKHAMEIFHASDALPHNELFSTTKYAYLLRSDDPEFFYNLALEFRKKNHDPDYLDLPVMEELAAVYTRQGKLDAAQEIQLRHLEITRNTYGVNDRHFVESVSTLTNFYYVNDNFIKAEEAYRNAFEAIDKTDGDTRKVKFQLLQDLTAYYYITHQFNEAEAKGHEGLNLAMAVLNKNDPDIANYARLLGQIFLADQKYDDSLQFFSQALDILNKAEPPKRKEKEIAQITDLLARTYCLLNRFNEARPLFEKLLTQLKNNSSLDPDDPAWFKKNYALLLFAEGKDAEAQPIFDDAVSFFKANKFPHLAASSWYQLAEVYRKKKLLNKAEEFYLLAIKGSTGAKGPRAFVLVDAQKKYAQLLRDTQRESEAIPLEKAARELLISLGAKP